LRLYPARDCREALNQLVGITRARTPIYRLATIAGQDALVADVRGALDNYDDAVGELRYRTLLAGAPLLSPTSGRRPTRPSPSRPMSWRSAG